MRKVVVVGGGASGMMAAIAAQDAGASVVLMEKTDRVGRKLLATGNGRCNIANRHLTGAAYHGTCASLTVPVFQRFGLRDTAAFFESLGLPVREEEGRLYPYNLQASSVQDVLRYEIARRGAAVRLMSPVTALHRAKNGWRVETASGGEPCDAVVLAAGGKAAPQLGSAGEGFALCRALKIAVTPLRPSLVRLLCDSPYLKRLSGVKVEGRADVGCEGNAVRTERGEILFTDEGVSGPPILQLSRDAGTLRAEGKQAFLTIDQFPERGAADLVQSLTARCRNLGYKDCFEAFNGILHKKMIPVMLLVCGIEKSRSASSLREEEIRRIAAFLKGWVLPVRGDAGFRDAQVTAGGIHRREVTDRLASVRYDGLYFAGEVLDIDGDCGGYNLQWAWSSGYVAGKEAAYGNKSRTARADERGAQTDPQPGGAGAGRLPGDSGE